MSGGTWQRRWQTLTWHPSLQRAARFALVGALGIVVQLLILEVLTALGCHYLWATVLAVEAAVLNNFTWHQKFTWLDRGDPSLAQARVRMLRFHLSNGLRQLAAHAMVGWSVGRAHARRKSVDHSSLLGGKLSRQRSMGFSVACSGGREGVVRENRRADDFADGLPSEGVSAVRREHK